MMRQMKHYKWTALCLVLLLTLSCFLTACSDTVGSPATEPESTQAQQKQEAENDDGADKDGEAGTVTGGASDADDAAGSEDTAQQPAGDDTAKPVQAEPAGNTQQPDAQEPQAQTCTISIDCSTILDNMDKLERGKEGLIPSILRIASLSSANMERYCSYSSSMQLLHIGRYPLPRYIGLWLTGKYPFCLLYAVPHLQQ